MRARDLQSHQARVAEQIRPDLALFEWRQMDAVDPPRQQPGQIGLAHAEGKLAKILAVAHQHIERLELDLGIVPARVQPVEVRAAVDAQQHRLAVNDEGRVPVSKRGRSHGLALGTLR